MTNPTRINQLLWKVLERHRLYKANPSDLRQQELNAAEDEVDEAIAQNNNCDDLDTTPLHSSDEITY